MIASFYSHAKDNTGTQVSIYDVLRNIKNGGWGWAAQVIAIRNVPKEQQETLKKALPAITFSGYFHPTRSLETCQSYNQIVVGDIDNLDQDRYSAYWKALVNDPYIFAMFTSPSGTGIKFLVRVDSTLEQHYDAFYCIEEYMQTQYGIALDPSGKDICRLCFVSYDIGLHYNPGSQVMHITASPEVRKKMYGDRDFGKKGFSISENDRYNFGVLLGWAEARKPIAKGSNPHIYYLACSANRCGMDKDRLYALCLQQYVELPVSALKETITKAYKQHESEFATQDIYVFDEKERKAGAGVEGFDLYSLEDILEEQCARPMLSISTGDRDIDKVLGGYQRGNVYAYVGPEKSYKSAHAVWRAVCSALDGEDVVYACGEMSRFQLLRMIVLMFLSRPGLRMDLNVQEIRENHNDEIRQFLGRINKHLVILDGDGFTEAAVISAGNKIKADNGLFPALTVIDGFQNWRKTSNKEYQSDDKASKDIKNMAKAIDTAVIFIAHTDSQCKPWNRNAIEFIRSKTVVRRNIDASFSFSRFVTNDSFPEGDMSNYQLRLDLAHVRVADYRNTGGVVDRMIVVSPDMAMRYAPELMASEYEVSPPNKNGGQVNW